MYFLNPFPLSSGEFVANVQRLAEPDMFAEAVEWFHEMIDARDAATDGATGDEEREEEILGIWVEMLLAQSGMAVVAAAAESGKPGIDAVVRELRFLFENPDESDAIAELTATLDEARQVIDDELGVFVAGLSRWLDGETPPEELPFLPGQKVEDEATLSRVFQYGLQVDSAEAALTGVFADWAWLAATLAALDETPGFGLPLIAYQPFSARFRAARDGWASGPAGATLKNAEGDPLEVDELSEESRNLLAALALDNFRIPRFAEFDVEDELAPVLRQIMVSAEFASESAPARGLLPVNAARVMAACGDEDAFAWIVSAIEGAEVPSARFDALSEGLEEAAEQFPQQYDDLYRATQSPTVLLACVLGLPVDVDEREAKALLKRASAFAWGGARLELTRLLGIYAPDAVLADIERQLKSGAVPDAWRDELLAARDFVEVQNEDLSQVN